MSAARANREVEIKLQLEDPGAARRLLRRAGFRVTRRRLFESNLVFDTPDLALRRAGKLLRLRVAGPAKLLTFKGPAEPGRHKSREEIEVRVSDPETLALILERLGMRPVFRYEKYRTEFGRGDAGGLVTLDETPIGHFLELEGTPEWIDETARELGFTPADYITASYGRLFAEYAARQPQPPPDMVFPGAPRSVFAPSSRGKARGRGRRNT